MFTIWGEKQRFCDGISRRNFLQIGALGTGLSLAGMLRLQAAQARVGTPIRLGVDQPDGGHMLKQPDEGDAGFDQQVERPALNPQPAADIPLPINDAFD